MRERRKGPTTYLGVFKYGLIYTSCATDTARQLCERVEALKIKCLV